VNDFKPKKISKGHDLETAGIPISDKTRQRVQTALAIILVMFFAYYGARQILAKLSNTRLINIISSTIGKDLQKDADGHTNILLLGVGGEGHEGANLTDTIMIASLDSLNNNVAMISIPRDLYVNSSLGENRINRLYEQGKIKWDEKQALSFAKDTIQKVFDIPLHYVMKVDFDAFKNVVDAVDGVDIYVEQEINDPQYPKGETYEYETFVLAKGLQHLDGETALKYVRSRKTTSDFDRSKRQQQVISAIKEKAATKNLLTSKSFLTNLYESLSQHFSTDMSLREMITLANFAAGWNSHDLSTITINDEPLFTGGFLYTPVRELYGGAFVLLPAGDNFDSVRFFARLVLYGPKNRPTMGIAILNGTKKSGLASDAKSIFNRYGAEIVATGNARNQAMTKIIWYTLVPEALPLVNILRELLPGEVSDQIPAEYLGDPKFANAKIILELGEDAKAKLINLDLYKNIFDMTPKAAALAPANSN
jgi:LCP family protein required for cell wall assembly